MYETYLLALLLACAAFIAVARQSIFAQLLSLDPMQAKLAKSIAEASTLGLTDPAVRRFWQSTGSLLDRRGIRGQKARRNRIVHALLICRKLLSQTEFEMARRMVRRVYADV